MAEVETLRELAQTQTRAATAARRHADDAAATAGALKAELITARAAAAERQDRASDELDSLLAVAAEAGLERRAARLADQLRTGALPADTWSPLLRELATDWRDVLHRHRELMRELRQAAGGAERARVVEREATARLEQAAARRAACEQQLEEPRAALEEEIDRLAGAHDDGPGPPKWLRADRVERAGARSRGSSISAPRCRPTRGRGSRPASRRPVCLNNLRQHDHGYYEVGRCGLASDGNDARRA